MGHKRAIAGLTLAFDFSQPVQREAPKRGTVHARAWFDGSCVGNPGETGMGGIVDLGDRRLEISERGGFGTNNEAEYQALILVFEKALENGVENLEVMGDSLLVVNQVDGRWRVSSENLQGLHRRATELKGRFVSCTLRWVKRDENREADALSTAAVTSARDEGPMWTAVWPE